MVGQGNRVSSDGLNRAYEKSIHPELFSSMVQEHYFSVISLVLVPNSHIKKFNCKMKPHFLGPMIVVHHMKGGE